MSLGFTEIILIVLFVLIVFGAKRIPELARALGRASYEFKKAKNTKILRNLLAFCVSYSIILLRRRYA